MASLVRITFGEPQSGMLPIVLLGSGTEISFTGSFIYPSLYNLVVSLHTLLIADGTRIIVWLDEPFEYEMQFSRAGDQISLIVQEFPDNRRIMTNIHSILSLSGSYEQVALPFWRAMRCLQGRYNEIKWKQK